jgi:sulfite exporter TauE/SafE
MLITAFVIGFLGSLHCAGMCSPLAMAVTNLSKPAFINRFTYNGGRIVSYGLQGIAAASIGTLFEFTGFQTVFSITLGTLLIIAGFAGITKFKIPLVTYAIQKLTTFIKVRLSDFINKKTKIALIITGMLNGLLPCGLTYMALTYCLTITNPVDGFFYMLVFGLGTLPVMLGLTSVVQMLITRFNVNFRKLTTVTMVVLGVLLICRSLTSHEEVNQVGSDGITLCSSTMLLP